MLRAIGETSCRAACGSQLPSWLTQTAPPPASKRQLCRRGAHLCRGLGMSGMGTPARSARILPAAVILVDGGPGTTLGLILAEAALYVAFGKCACRLCVPACRCIWTCPPAAFGNSCGPRISNPQVTFVVPQISRDLAGRAKRPTSLVNSANSQNSFEDQWQGEQRTLVMPSMAGVCHHELGQRMATLVGAIVCQAIVHHYGRDEFLRRLSHPFWFQSFGAVMGIDWHSSGEQGCRQHRSAEQQQS